MALAGVALAAVTAVAAASTGRLLADPWHAVGGVLVGVSAHGVLRVAEHRRWSQVALVLVLAGVVPLVVAWGAAPGTTAFGIPTADTLEGLVTGLRDGMVALRTGRLPSAPDPITGVAGVAVVGCAAAVVVALASDRLAFAHGRPLAALLPATGMLAVTSALGDDRGQLLVVASFVATAVAFLLLAGPGSSGVGMFRAGWSMLVVALVFGPGVGPSLPWATAEGLVELGEPTGDAVGDRVTVSPLLEVGDFLRQSPPVELFSVAAPAPAYWRLTALDRYADGVWAADSSYRPAPGRLPRDADADIPTESMVQTFSISRLSQFWLPAAYRPVSVDLPGARVSDESLALITDQASAAGLTYTVRSELPRYEAPQLQAGRVAPSDELAPFLALPQGLPVEMVHLAEDATATARTPFERALALQRYLRTQYTYRAESPAGHTERHLLDFLVRRREGNCEQFASAFALMARWLQLPSRVAVGFTPGTYDPVARAYRVTTADIHAWPEVHLEPFGWVAFEPTPQRFEPSPANHTGTFDADLYARHVEPGGAVRADDDSYEANQVVVEDLPPAPESPEASEAEEDAARPTEVSRSLYEQFRVWVLVALLVVLGVILQVVVRRRLRRQQQRRLAPSSSVLAAWHDVAVWMRRRRLTVSDADTPQEVVERARHEATAPIVEDLSGLAALVEAAVYGPGEAEATSVDSAWRHHAAIVEALRRDRGRREGVPAGR